jgi:hypothetical protein
MYLRDCANVPTERKMPNESSSSFFIFIFLKQETQSKYTGNKPSPPRRAGTLGEIVNSAISSTYFTELPAAAGISIVFLSP